MILEWSLHTFVRSPKTHKLSFGCHSIYSRHRNPMNSRNAGERSREREEKRNWIQKSFVNNFLLIFILVFVSKKVYLVHYPRGERNGPWSSAPFGVKTRSRARCIDSSLLWYILNKRGNFINVDNLSWSVHYSPLIQNIRKYIFFISFSFAFEMIGYYGRCRFYWFTHSIRIR